MALPPDPTPIPFELVVGGRELTEPKPSPDGVHVVFVQRLSGSSALVLVAARGGPERLLATIPEPAAGRGLGGGCFDWLPDSSGVAYVARDGEVWVHRERRAPRRLTTWERSCRAPAVSPDGSAVVVTVDEAEVWAIDVAGGSTRRLDDGDDAFCFDPAIAPDGRSVTWQAWSPPNMPWDASHQVIARLAGRPAPRRRILTDGAIQQPRFLPDGATVAVDDAGGWLNLIVDTLRVEEAAEHAGPTWGMGQRSYAVAPDGRRIAFTRNESGFGRLCVAEVDAARTSASVVEVARGVHGALSWVDGHLCALRTGARTPTQVVRYDPVTFQRTVLAVGPAAGWDAFELPEPETVEVDVEGTALFARRYAAGEGRMLCWVHGGPTDQWQVDFRPRIAYWWSRGWDVLVVDPRGTTGHGRAHQRALNGAWGRLDVDDTARLIAAAHRRGWARPDTTVVIGGSSGGLTVLGVLADHPWLVVGGVASYPVSDLAALADSTHRFEAHYTETLVGPLADAARFAELSPLGRAHRIRGPLLLFHGSDDPVVSRSQSEALADAIRAGGGAVQLVVYEGEGHGLRDPDNVRDEYDRTERFLADVAG